MAVVSLAEAKIHLNITTSTLDAELVDFINRAQTIIERHVRELATTVGLTVRVEGGGRSGLCLPTGQTIASVQSVTPVGSSALLMSDLFVRTSAGVVEWNLGGTFEARAYDVVYTAGYAVTPDDLKLAVLELLRHVWDTQRGGSSRPGTRGSESLANTLASAAFTLPNRVTEILKPRKRTAVA